MTDRSPSPDPMPVLHPAAVAANASGPRRAAFDAVYITATGACYPGPAIGNDAIDRYIQPLDAASSRIKRRVLADNGIATRHYAIDSDGSSSHSVAGMAADAVRACVGADGLAGIDLLATGTSCGDLILPGFANQLQAALRAPAMTTASHHGVCAAGMSALQHAALALQHGSHQQALVAAAEMPSRLFKRQRFARVPGGGGFDAQFLRWMLSDGAAAWRLSRAPGPGTSLKLLQLHLTSFAGEMPLCMQAGQSPEGRAWGDFDDFPAADAAGAMLLRQDVRLLPQLFDLGTHEYARLAREGAIDPSAVDHFLCHYSSARFARVVRDCLKAARLEIPDARWYSNLSVRGNLGAAAIFAMLDDFVRSRTLRLGEKILLFVPESARFTVCFALLEVVEGVPTAAAMPSPRPAASQARVRGDGTAPAVSGLDAQVSGVESGSDLRGASLPGCMPAGHGDTGTAVPSTADTAACMPPPPQEATADQPAEVARLLRELAQVWHDYRGSVWRTPLVTRILDGSVTQDDYVDWMAQWVPQVRQGSLWMRRAADNLTPRYAVLRDTVHHHADDEQHDYGVLFDDYLRAGGTAASIDDLRRNPGGDALDAYLHARAAQPDAVGLLGAMYIIEGTGQRIVPALLPLLRRRLGWLGRSFAFLAYHGENDVAHLERWLQALTVAVGIGGREAAEDILDDARIVAVLYARQLAMIR